MAFTFCSLGSGSGGNCAVVRAGRTTVLLDAGFSAREMSRRLAGVGVQTTEVDAILLTHEHLDHVRGAAVASRRWRRPVVCRPAVARRAGLENRAGTSVETMELEPFQLGDLRITPFTVPHDAVETVGFVVEGEGVRVAYATDLGRPTPEVEAHLRGCQIIVLEANHDVDMTRAGPYPWSLKQRILGGNGHLSNQEAGTLLGSVVGSETTAVVLAHLSGTNNAPHLAMLEARAGLERSRNPRASLTTAGQDSPGRPIRL